jgi:hypothetical protein
MVPLFFGCISGPLWVLLLFVVISYSSTHWSAVPSRVQCGRVVSEAVVHSGIGSVCTFRDAGGGAPAAVGRGYLLSLWWIDVYVVIGDSLPLVSAGTDEVCVDIWPEAAVIADEEHGHGMWLERGHSIWLWSPRRALTCLFRMAGEEVSRGAAAFAQLGALFWWYLNPFRVSNDTVSTAFQD